MYLINELNNELCKIVAVSQSFIVCLNKLNAIIRSTSATHYVEAPDEARNSLKLADSN